VRLLKALVVIFALIGCLAVSGVGFFIYSKIKSGTFQFKNPIVVTGNNKNAQTSAPLTSSNPDNDAILRAYQKPVATPIPAAVGNSTGPVVTISNPAAAAPTATKVPTPGPDLKMIREWPTGRKWVSLTFDDGPHPEWTPKFMELLKSKNVKATFFLIGPNIQTHSDIAKSLASSGFEIGNHTMTHPQFSKAPIDKITQELTQTNEIIKTVTGLTEVYLMRPPYGMAPTNVQKVCGELGLHIICWNIDTNDWNKRTTEQEMLDNVMKNVRDGSIILMHDRSEKSYNTTAKVIDLIQQKGY
jgi:peptidoglycan/xylan/chitin deacetylase (PgdA/CDA1 family)